MDAIQDWLSVDWLTSIKATSATAWATVAYTVITAGIAFFAFRAWATAQRTLNEAREQHQEAMNAQREQLAQDREHYQRLFQPVLEIEGAAVFESGKVSAEVRNIGAGMAINIYLLLWIDGVSPPEWHPKRPETAQIPEPTIQEPDAPARATHQYGSLPPAGKRTFRLEHGALPSGTTVAVGVRCSDALGSFIQRSVTTIVA